MKKIKLVLEIIAMITTITAIVLLFVGNKKLSDLFAWASISFLWFSSISYENNTINK